ncbi:MAG: PAN domain-containing protein [Methanospirillum sp.]|uniref:PAN domain-containing protein n=1 Tax=Methanospirillum sp. TaxID=45200 RepID=UPI00236AEECC|nr:PAN domain-containing protein [Methanospirillum sp.]MDD1729809.1 PAN domain-containing protein [Methanospirillum sp.]
MAFLLVIPWGVLGSDTYTVEDNTDRLGMDMSHYVMNPGDTCDVCAESCLDNTDCMAYTYVKAGVQDQNPVCWLKKGVPDPASDSCCISGVRTSSDSSGMMGNISGNSSILRPYAILPRDSIPFDRVNESIPINTIPIVPIVTIIPWDNVSPFMTPAPSDQIIINFDDIPSTGPGEGNQQMVSNQYADKGITFSYPYPLVFNYLSGPNPSKYQGFTHSGLMAIEQCYGKEFCKIPIVMNFTTGQKTVKAWVGYSSNLAKMKIVIMRAYDSSGKLIQQYNATLQPNTVPTRITIPLEVSSDSGDIFSVTLQLTDANGGTWTTNNLAVDDIEFNSTGPAPVCEDTQVPYVGITQPKTGIIVRNNKFDLRGIISTTAPLLTAYLFISGSEGNKSLNLLSDGTVSSNGGEFNLYGITDMLTPGSNTVTISTQNCLGESNDNITVLFNECNNVTLPFVDIIHPNPSEPEITIRSDDTDEVLNGTISSPSSITGVQVNVISGLPAGGMRSFSISTDGNGFFSIPLNSTNLFNGPNTIHVSAVNSDGCSGEAITQVTFEKTVLKRIAGDTFLQFTLGDPQDTHIPDNGWEYISHDPGCGIHGNDGVDTFFSSKKPLPFWCDLKEIQFIRFQPDDVNPNTIIGYDFTETGRYGVGYNIRGITLAQSLVDVEWHNTCWNVYGGKDLNYAISFIVSIPEMMTGDDLGEPLYDPSATNPDLHPGIIKPPDGYYLLNKFNS